MRGSTGLIMEVEKPYSLILRTPLGYYRALMITYLCEESWSLLFVLHQKKSPSLILRAASNIHSLIHRFGWAEIILLIMSSHLQPARPLFVHKAFSCCKD